MIRRDEPSWRGAWRSDLVDEIRRGFAEFLTVPTVIIVGFLVFAAGSYAVDRADQRRTGPSPCPRDASRLRRGR